MYYDPTWKGRRTAPPLPPYLPFPDKPRFDGNKCRDTVRSPLDHGWIGVVNKLPRGKEEALLPEPEP